MNFTQPTPCHKGRRQNLRKRPGWARLGCRKTRLPSPTVTYRQLTTPCVFLRKRRPIGHLAFLVRQSLGDGGSLKMLRVRCGLLRQMLRVELLQVLDNQQMLRCCGSIPLRLRQAGAALSRNRFAPRQLHDPRRNFSGGRLRQQLSPRLAGLAPDVTQRDDRLQRRRYIQAFYADRCPDCVGRKWAAAG